MGLIDHDVYQSNNGVEKINVYISFTNETIYLVKNIIQTSPTSPDVVDPVKPYRVYANYRVYWDKEARDAGKPFMDLKSVEQNIDNSQLNESLYGILYLKLKEIYPNSTDD